MFDDTDEKVDQGGPFFLAKLNHHPVLTTQLHLLRQMRRMLDPADPVWAAEAHREERFHRSTPAHVLQFNFCATCLTASPFISVMVATASSSPSTGIMLTAR